MKLTENEFAELAEILITNEDGLLRSDSYNWNKLKQHPSFKTLIDNYEKARKWDELCEPKAICNIGEHLSLRVQDKQNQKLRELIEKRIKELKLTVGVPEPKTLDELQKLLEGSKK